MSQISNKYFEEKSIIIIKKIEKIIKIIELFNSFIVSFSKNKIKT